MPKGYKYNGQEATQKLLEMATESSDNLDSEPEEYMTSVLHKEGAICVYGRKCGRVESSVMDKDKT